MIRRIGEKYVYVAIAGIVTNCYIAGRLHLLTTFVHGLRINNILNSTKISQIRSLTFFKSFQTDLVNLSPGQCIEQMSRNRSFSQ